MQSVIDKMVYSLSAPTNKNVVWVKPTGHGTFEMRIYDNNTWVPLSSSGSGGSGGSGSGIAIVDSVDKLDPNAEVGSIASVATPGSIQETSFRNLYQPDASMIDQNTGALTQPKLLSSVSSVAAFAPADINNLGFEIVESSFGFVTRDFSMENQNMVMISIVPSYGVGAITMTGGFDTRQEFMFIEYSQDTMSYIVDNDQVEAFNTFLANGMDWCYMGSLEGAALTEEQFNTIDLFLKAVAGVPSITSIYVKGDKWGKLHESDLNSILKKIDAATNTLSNKADIIPVTSTSISSGTLDPNTYYKINCGAYSNLNYRLGQSIDPSVYSEYIIQLTCTGTPSSVKFRDSAGNELLIKWANGIEPVFVGGCTYIISIVDNLGVFAQYVNP